MFSQSTSQSDPFSLISPPVIVDGQPSSNPPVKLGVLASGNGSNFVAIAQAIARGELQAQIQVLIYNHPDAKVAARAAEWGIPAQLINHRDYKARRAFDQEVALALQNYGVEWVIMAGWMRRATEVLLDAFPERVLNLHPSLLPSFPGAHGVKEALEAGVKITGCTVHFAQLAVDSGPIVIQAAVPVLPDDTIETLHNRIHVQEHRILPLAIALVTGQLAVKR